jgi:hypothetical protein
MVLQEEKGTRMKLRISNLAFGLCAAILLAPTLAFAESSALILAGISRGQPELEEKYNKWAEETRKTLVDKHGFTANRVMILAGKNTAKADIEKAFAQVKQQLKPTDTFFLFLIGHGSFGETAEGPQYKFNGPSPQLTGADYNRLLSTLSVARTVIVNSTSNSGGSVEALAGKNRVIITATRSGNEGNETRFYEYFLAALQNPEADEDKDKKISTWEAFKYAAAAVEKYYKDEGQLATEHPQIAVNGAPPVTTTAPKDIPVMARVTSFQVDRPVVVSDARLQALLNERKEIEGKIETLRINKAALPEAEYNKTLEDLSVELALKNQQIRELEKK